MSGQGRCGRGRGRRGRSADEGGGDSNIVSKAVEEDILSAMSYGTVFEDIAEDVGLDINHDVRNFFLGLASFPKHVEAQEENLSRYTAAMALLLKNGVELASNSRVRALAAAWARRNHALADSLLTLRNAFGLPEVLKALAILDAERMTRVWERKLKQAEVGAAVSGGRVKKRTLSRAKNNRDNLRALRPTCVPQATLSGALVRRLRRWVRRFSREELEFFVLHYPAEPWRRLADLLHLNPEKDFPALPWFLRYCYNEEVPPESYIHKAKQITLENVNEVIAEVPVPFSVVRHLAPQLTAASKAAIVRADDRVDRALWWYEELSCAEVDEAITRRLEAGEAVQLNYGKLMERLLTFSLASSPPPFLPLLMPYAEAKLQATQLSLDSPIAVLADASYSMSVAIHTATIIASLLSAFTSAKLVFFNEKFWFPEAMPRNTQDVLDLALRTTAQSCTAHAAGLWPFYERKELIRTFIVVTDEEENWGYQNVRFQKLYERYRSEVYGAQLVFISFLASQSAEGGLVPGLRAAGHRPLQFRMDRNRPDLTKLDSILGHLAAACADFNDQLTAIEEQMKSRGVEAVFADVAAKVANFSAPIGPSPAP